MIRITPMTLLLLATLLNPASANPGQMLYVQQCAKCHGEQGEGTKKSKTPLRGELAVPQLAKIVQETMPEDAPGSLSLADATTIAQYMHETFYSKAAREKNAPRIELARLTVGQYRQSIADIIESFRFRGTWNDKRGLNGVYYGARNFQRKSHTRVDRLIDFDFGTNPPEKVVSEVGEFSISWFGSVLAPTTGVYQFIVETDQAFRLFVNDNTKPILDAWVKSGTETRFVAEIDLIGGRGYPIKLEWTKSKVGVNDTKTKKPVPTPAFVRLLWKPPHAAATVIPPDVLTPNPFPESFVTTTAFPPDDRSYGWERGTTVSRQWESATTDAALETVAYILNKIHALAKTQFGAPDYTAKLKTFCSQFAERAFRQPLNPELKALYIDRPFQDQDPNLALKKSLIMILKSPRFLYREVGDGNEDYERAARLAFTLWDSIPDEELSKLAATGKLKDQTVLRQQAERMLKDPRALAKMRGFFHHWLALDHAPDVVKDQARFPGFDDQALADLRASLDRQLLDAFTAADSDYRKLFTTDTVLMNKKLGKLYGVEVPSDVDFVPVKLNPAQRSGILTHPYLMTAYSAGSESSPIHRGVFVARGLLGVRLKPPPEAVSPVAPDLHPTLNTRERVLLQTKAATCMTCHGVINPLGFPLENFDAVGRYRELDNNKPVNAQGEYLTRDGKTVTFRNARELGQFLADSPEAQGAFVEQLFHHLAQQSIAAYGANTQSELLATFTQQKFHMRNLATEIALRVAQQPRKSTK